MRWTVRVFVSHAGRDRAWAEWIAWQLVGAGVDVATAAEQPMAASAASDTSIANAITLRRPADLNSA